MHVAGDLKDLGFLGLKEGRRKSHRGGEERAEWGQHRVPQAVGWGSQTIGFSLQGPGITGRREGANPCILIISYF